LERQATEDGRFRALALVSPGFAMLFDRPSLAAVSIPVLLLGAGGDGLNRPERQARVLRDALPGGAEYRVLPGADGPSLQAACPPDMAGYLPDLCASVSPEERRDIHARLEGVLADFFARTLR
jgi:predicted dienelactone hydrolase